MSYAHLRPEILEEIFRKLSPPDILSCHQVSRHWRASSSNLIHPLTLPNILKRIIFHLSTKSYLEVLNCREVCKSWKAGVDKLAWNELILRNYVSNIAPMYIFPDWPNPHEIPLHFDETQPVNQLKEWLFLNKLAPVENPFPNGKVKIYFQCFGHTDVTSLLLLQTLCEVFLHTGSYIRELTIVIGQCETYPCINYQLGIYFVQKFIQILKNLQALEIHCARRREFCICSGSWIFSLKKLNRYTDTIKDFVEGHETPPSLKRLRVHLHFDKEEGKRMPTLLSALLNFGSGLEYLEIGNTDRKSEDVCSIHKLLAFLNSENNLENVKKLYCVGFKPSKTDLASCLLHFRGIEQFKVCFPSGGDAVPGQAVTVHEQEYVKVGDGGQVKITVKVGSLGGCCPKPLPRCSEGLDSPRQFWRDWVEIFVPDDEEREERTGLNGRTRLNCCAGNNENGELLCGSERMRKLCSGYYCFHANYWMRCALLPYDLIYCVVVSTIGWCAGCFRRQ